MSESECGRGARESASKNPEQTYAHMHVKTRESGRGGLLSQWTYGVVSCRYKDSGMEGENRESFEEAGCLLRPEIGLKSPSVAPSVARRHIWLPFNAVPSSPFSPSMLRLLRPRSPDSGATSARLSFRCQQRGLHTELHHVSPETRER